MPELPEVETIRRGLVRHLIGREVTGIEVRSSRAARHEEWDGRGMAPPALAAVAGTHVTEVARRGKFLWLTLAGRSNTLALHLGMSGQLLFRDDGEAGDPSHIAAVVSLERGARLIFRDQRTFGWLRSSPLVPTSDGAPGGAGTARPLVPLHAAHIARDPHDPAFDLEAVAARLHARTAAIKGLLLDQTIISGIGNIYADEALFAARLHPLRPGASISVRTLERLVGEANRVMAEAIAAGGTSFDALYVNTAGNSGYFERELQAYGRRGLPCLKCGRLMESLIVAGRSSHVCSNCQK